MKDSIILRQAMAEDLLELQTLFIETVNEVCKKDYNEEQLQVWTASIKNKERWLDKLKSQYFLAAIVNHQIVGFGSLENGTYLDFMYVHKDYQRNGIANKIFNSLEQEARRLGTRILKSDVSKTARPFFERKGFKVISEKTRTINGVEITNNEMQKLL